MPADDHPTSELLSGWGSTAPSVASVVPFDDLAAIESLVKTPDRRGVLARGLGRAYGDAAQNGGGVVVDGPSSAGLIDFDVNTGVVTARAGTSLDQLMRWLVPLGWFVPVCPGTRAVTVGGAIAADVHGKNHHVAGSWCAHVESIRLMVGDGSVVDVSRDRDPDAFWATCGGMGLTGIIVDATFQMASIETAWVSVDTRRATDLDDVMNRMVANDDRYEMSVAWLDLLAQGRHMGRSVLQRANQAPRELLSPKANRRALVFDDHSFVTAPHVPSGLINAASIRLFNEMWFRKAPKFREGELQHLGTFLHPLDRVERWNRIYGPRGFLQWQMVVPSRRSDVVEHCVEVLSGAGVPSFLALLKRFGPGDSGHLSFPSEGWTLALDMPVLPDLNRLLDGLDHVVAEAEGRIYLAKDSRMRGELLPTMYPRLGEWREIRERLDPQHRFQSDLSRRLAL